LIGTGRAAVLAKDTGLLVVDPLSAKRAKGLRELPPADNKIIKLMIVEDEGLFRDMLKISLSGVSNFEVLDAVGTGNDALRSYRELHPDVVLMDIELGSEPNGIETGRLIRQEDPKVGIVILSMHKDKEYLSSLSLEEASGWSYVLKQSVGDLAALSRAIEGSAAGFVVLDPEVVTGLTPKQGSFTARLTPRQQQVLALMAQGFNNAAIAEKLVLGPKSVENYINAIYQELNLAPTERIHPRVYAVLRYIQDSYSQ
jgi:DNA-binding NarL/FixJ family response regulator